MLRRCACVLGALVSSSAASGVAARADASPGANDCAPARIRGNVAALHPAWRDALFTLVANTSREGQPWSCPNATVRLLPGGPDAPALLEVEDAYGIRRRPVDRPEDLVPLGEAMLATLPEDPPAALPPVTPPPPPPPPPLGAGPPLRDAEPPPHRELGSSTGSAFIFDGLAGVRYTGPTKALLVGPELRATYVSEQRWSAGLVGRYDTAVDMLQPVPPQFCLSSVTVGLAAGYALVTQPFELTAFLEPSLAVVLLGAMARDASEPNEASHVDMRLGGRLAAAIPLTHRVRVTFALGAEGTPEPASQSEGRLTHHFGLPPIPQYLLGGSLGFELKASR